MNILNKEAPERQEIEALLPWHAAGTLSRRDSERVERALASDRELARHFELVREELHETIHLNESLGAPSSRAMEKLFAAIEADGKKAPVRRQYDLASRVCEFIASFSPRTIAYAGAAAAFAIVIQAVALTAVLVKDQSGQNMELASVGASGTLAVRFVSQASASDITRFLNAYKAVVIDGPKKGGIYDIRLADANLPPEEVTQVVRRMQSETKIVEFIAAKD